MLLKTKRAWVIRSDDEDDTEPQEAPQTHPPEPERVPVHVEGILLIYLNY
jgi:hypothetical protein